MLFLLCELSIAVTNNSNKLLAYKNIITGKKRTNIPQYTSRTNILIYLPINLPFFEARIIKLV